jgi:hypothetical protein
MVLPIWIELFCRRDQVRGRVNPDRPDLASLEHAAKSSLATPNVKRAFESSGRNAFQHYRIEHMLARPVSPAYIPHVEGAISEQFWWRVSRDQGSWGASLSTSRSVSCSQAFMSFLALR